MLKKFFKVKITLKFYQPIFSNKTLQYICTRKMKRGIIYILAGLFLLFSVKSKSNFMQTLETGFVKHVDHVHTPKKGSLPNLEKSATPQETDGENFSIETADEDFSSLGDLHFLFYAGIVGFVFLFSHLYQLKDNAPFNSESHFYLLKRFILIRDLRI